MPLTIGQGILSFYMVFHRTVFQMVLPKCFIGLANSRQCGPVWYLKKIIGVILGQHILFNLDRFMAKKKAQILQ